jgi:hypothetical protein
MYRNPKSHVWLGIGIFAVICGLVFGPAIANIECPTYIWIDCGKQTREKDGSITQRYNIRSNVDGWTNGTESSDYQAFYRLDAKSSKSKSPYCFDRSFPETGYYNIPVTCADGELYLDINSATNARLELYVHRICDGKKLSARIVHPLFGRASSDDEPRIQGPVMSIPADLPRLYLPPFFQNYYMQTGQSYPFGYTDRGATVKTMSILENRKHIADIVRAPDGTFVYKPLHDPKLDSTGPYDFKEAIAMVKETAAGWDYVTTYTLLLHRSYIAHLKLLPGLVLFGVTAALFAVIVGCKRKRGSG